jgi:hypothetical protein
MALIRQTQIAGQPFSGAANDGLFDPNGLRPVSRSLQIRVNSVGFSTTSTVGVELVRVSPEGDEVVLFRGTSANLYVQGLVLPTSDDGRYYTLQLRSLALPGPGVVTFDYDAIGTEQ